MTELSISSRISFECPSSISFAIFGELTRISTTGMRPWPSIRSMSCIETDRAQDEGDLPPDLVLLAVGQLSMMRSIVCAALFVWSVEKTRWPVSAAVMAVCIVSQSRISPTMMTSGSCRIAFRSASWNEIVSVPTSRWQTDPRLSWKRYSIGSSTVTTWTGCRSVIPLMMPASVVDLPEPVGPVTRTRPAG